MPGPPPEEPKYTALRSAGMLLAIPTLLIVAPLVGGAIGGWLDRRLKSSPWLLILGLILGFVAAGRETFQIYRRYQEQEERD
ncbi:MAG TPA: AtpZ/AtpI family protein [Candidatus Saccharimonadaceae bacterium]|jgi:F0F1-type ATP synthase assembly protein I|nr:AtpZ/AtpI family protein [Candidatus Saccharimonadaceae bacterium]